MKPMLASSETKLLPPVANVTAGAGLGIGHGITPTLLAAGWSVLIDLVESLIRPVPAKEKNSSTF